MTHAHLSVDAQHAAAEDRIALLTRRQKEVLALMARGLSNAAIARTLFITEKSVGEHTSNVYDTLGLAPADGAHHRVLAVVRFLAAPELASR